MKTPAQLRSEVRTWKFTAKKYASMWRKARKEFHELEGSLRLIRDSDDRARKMWQAAHPEHERLWPDRGRMIFWLLDRLDLNQKVREELPAMLLKEINRLAALDIEKGNPIEGAHHRAIEKYLKALK